MKKIFLSLTAVLSLLLILTACGTNNISESNDTDIAGLWTYEEPNEQDPTMIVNFDLGSDKNFELEITKNALSDDLENNTAVVTGTYKDDGTDLKLTVNKVDGENNIVKAEDEVNLGYELSGDSEALTINGMQKLNPDLPDSIELSRNNDSN